MQVVWASSKKFGIGKATTMLDNMLCTWVVALYEPSGAMRNMQGENVLIGLFDYQYCDTFGKGGGGKGASSGVIHNNADTKISAPNAAQQPAGKRGLLYSEGGTLETTGSNEEANVLSDEDVVKGTSQEFMSLRTPNKMEDGLVKLEDSKSLELKSFINNSLKARKDINRKSGAEERSKTHRKSKRKKARKHVKTSKHKRNHLRRNHKHHHHHHHHHHLHHHHHHHHPHLHHHHHRHHQRHHHHDHFVC